jgi:hypothetical protein
LTAGFAIRDFAERDQTSLMHRFIPNPEDAPPALDPSHTLAIKRWTREVLKLGEDIAVTVSEIPCVDAGCPLVETTIAVFPTGTAPRQWKLTRPRVAVTKMMIQQTLASPPSA